MSDPGEAPTQVLRPLEPKPLEAEHGSSVLDAIRRRREQHMAERELVLPVVGYFDLLALRCGAMDSEVWEELMRRQAAAAGFSHFALSADVLLHGCQEVVGRESKHDPWGPLREGEHVRIEYRLAELLELDVPPPPQGRARELVRALYAQAPSPAPMPEVVLGMDANRYMEWARGESSEVDDELLGESGPGRP